MNTKFADKVLRMIFIFVLVIGTVWMSNTSAGAQISSQSPVTSTGGHIALVSVASDGTQGNLGAAWSLSISADGRYVAFESDSSNLVSGDTNGANDIFVHDRQTGETRCVSVASDGTQGNDLSTSPSISANGRYVAFASEANNLVNGDTNNSRDVFVHDLQTGETMRVSVASDGTQAQWNPYFDYHPSISADGRFVAFASGASNLVSGDTNNDLDIFVHDLQTGETTLVSAAYNDAHEAAGGYSPSISADGRYAAFTSVAGNLVSGDTNDRPDVFIRDLQTTETRLVSVASDGTQQNCGSSYDPTSVSISADGRYVVFPSSASNLVSGDTNDVDDFFVHDLQTGKTTRVSVASDGTQGNGESSTPLGGPSISADGRYVAFVSTASNMVSGDTNDTYDVFVHDLQTGETRLVSVALDGLPANGLSASPSISADGRYVAFTSGASNLVSGDTNGFMDVFVRDLQVVRSFTLKGFYQPVDMNGVYNTVKGGSTVPLKFEIFAGSTELSDVAYIKSLTYAQTSCDATAITDEIETTATGNTSLRYADGQFIYNWKTPKNAGKCYRVTMSTIDDSSLVAYFKFK